jgi:hypothetical protein
MNILEATERTVGGATPRLGLRPPTVGSRGGQGPERGFLSLFTLPLNLIQGAVDMGCAYRYNPKGRVNLVTAPKLSSRRFFVMLPVSGQ